METNNNDDLRYNQKNIDTEIVVMTLSIISLLASLSLVFILFYKYNKLVKDKWLTHVVLMIAICDSFVSLSFSIGYPPPGRLCQFQGFLLEFFEKCSWLWTDLLILNIYGIVLYKKCLVSIKYGHLVIWSINIILAMLPFTDNVYYGGEGYIDGCGYQKTTNTRHWDDLSHIMLITSLIFIIIMTFRIMIFVYTLHYDRNNGIEVTLLTHTEQLIAMEATTTMMLYPVAMVFW
jgi:hypothetical protein